MSEIQTDSNWKGQDTRNPPTRRYGQDSPAKPSKAKAIRTLGLHPHRFKSNPEEKRIAESWERQYRRYLPNLLQTEGNPMYPPPVSERDEAVAATVIQWLGSSCGQSWLAQLGYERPRRKR